MIVDEEAIEVEKTEPTQTAEPGLEPESPETREKVRLQEAVNGKVARYRREWHERYSSLLVGRRHWKMVACGALAVIALQAVLLWDTARHARQADVVVLAQNGSNLTYVPMQPQTMDDATWDAARVDEWKIFITAWRTVTSDEVAQGRDWDTAFAFVADNSQAYRTLAKWYAENDPFKRAKNGERVTVQWKTHEPPQQGSHTYLVWWTETTSNASGQLVGQQEWQARIVYGHKIPSSPFARSVNGLGMLASELSVEPVEATR
jgi:type IV secretory pathway TrbF-like protein